jgi:hypothetical protein
MIHVLMVRSSLPKPPSAATNSADLRLSQLQKLVQMLSKYSVVFRLPTSEVVPFQPKSIIADSKELVDVDGKHWSLEHCFVDGIGFIQGRVIMNSLKKLLSVEVFVSGDVRFQCFVFLVIIFSSLCVFCCFHFFFSFQGNHYE